MDIKEKRRPSPPRWRKVLKYFLLLITLPAIGVCLYASPFILFVGKFMIGPPLVQHTLDSLRHRNHIPVLVPKTSDLIAFVCRESTGRDSVSNRLYTMRPDGNRLRDISISSSKVHYDLDWSPDGEWLTFTLAYRNYSALMDEWSPLSPYDEVYRIRYDGTESRRVTYEDSYKNTPRWTRDGRDILYHDTLSGSWLLHRVSLQAANTRAVTTFEIAGYDLSPDRLKVAAIARNPDRGPTSIYQLNPDGTDLQHLFSTDFYVSAVHWSPDKRRIRYHARFGRLQIFNIEDGEEETLPPIRVRSARWSPDNRWIAIIGGLDHYRENDGWTLIQGTLDDELSDKLYLLDLETGRLKQLFDAPEFASGLSWSPDSQWLAFSHGAPNAQVHKIRVDGSGLRQLTDLHCDAYGVAWSPK